MHIVGGLDRFAQYLINYILDEFGPLHVLITIDIDLLEQSDEALDHFEFLCADRWDLKHHEPHELEQV